MLNGNNATIRDVVEHHSDFVVLAWGMPVKFNISLPLYYTQIFEVQNIVRESQLPIFVPKCNGKPNLSKQQNPFHPIMKKMTGLVKVNINQLNEIVVL
ncbi:hypothetical protein PAESOLCIP111_06731 [Paenibacillus solanacearum]|uniref:DUF1643 domain-containing protein n=2 Tax=Paenibacillus solanacearum TaxID=2048548 RepID=A0A916KAR6_9BACL|nr:hypothetical protein PAESOLCIP111_06731 [Paenibacillus solanacearum]